jgi:hypothetical protein
MGEVDHQRRPTLDRRRRQERVEHPAVLELLRWIHLQEAGADLRVRVGDLDAPVAARRIGILHRREEVGVLVHLADGVEPGDHPVPAVVLTPSHRAPAAQLVAELRVVVLILR